MAVRHRSGVAFSGQPRVSDLRALVAPEQSTKARDRKPDGTFKKGNRISVGNAAAHIIKRVLGGKYATSALIKDVTRVYRGLLADLPSDGASVRQLVASRAYLVVLGKLLRDEAERVGLTSETGLRLLAEARSNDLAAQRLAITSYDIAVREASAATEAKRAQWIDADEAEGEDA